MKVSIPASVIVSGLIFINCHSSKKSELIVPPCPGNIVIEWQTKQKQKEENQTERKHKK
jgi:hypothetical protein